MSEKISILWLTCGLPEVSSTCVEHLARNTRWPAELVWVDNGSTTAERAAVRAALGAMRFPVVEVLLPENTGWVGGCSAGLAAAEAGNDVALLNNDTRPGSGWLSALAVALDAYPRLGIVGSLTQNDQQWQGVPRLRGRWPELRDAPSAAEEIGPWLWEQQAGVVKTVPGMVAFFAALIRREVIEEIGWLDPIFGLGLADDDDYCARARDAGWEIGVALDSYVPHDHRTTFRSLEEEGKIGDLGALQARNLNLYREKRRDAQARPVAPGVVLRYLGRNGSPFVMNIPARDLSGRDLAELELEWGIGRSEVLRSGLYVEVTEGEFLGPAPFCSAPGCRAPVARWGDYCPAHEVELEQIRGIGPETARALGLLEVDDVAALAAVGNEALTEMAGDLPRISERQLFEWRAEARRRVGGVGGADRW